MGEMSGLLTAVLVSLLVSTAIVVTLARPLRGVLQQLCPGSEATAFWVTFTAVMLYVTPLLFTVLFPRPSATSMLVHIIRASLASSLAGAFAALLVVGYQISRER